MHLLLDLLAWTLSLAIGLPTLVFATEILLGLKKPRARSEVPAAVPATRILIPAHDEELGIGEMLTRLLAELPPGMTPLVVADNCSDRTAEIVRGLGVEAIERHDASLRGKGYALAFGRDHLRGDPPECVIVFDADCAARRADLARLAAAAYGEGSAFQATYLLEPDPAAPPMVQVSSFAMAVKNVLRQQGLSRLGAPVLLTGTGMAFPWRLFEPLPLASGSLAEDLELGIALTEAGHPPRFLPEAEVWSRATNASATLVQRSRWEGGFVAMARRHALPLIARGIRKGRWGRLWLGLHLATPPAALLVLINLFVLAAIAILTLAGASPFPLLVLLTLNVVAAVALASAWRSIGRPYLTAAAAARLPLYALWKIPIYLKLLRGGEKQWVRTERTP